MVIRYTTKSYFTKISHLLLLVPNKVHKFQETTTMLGPVCDTNDPTEFLRKLEEDSSSWVIIDKKPDQAHSLVSVWQIIDNQLQAFATDPTKVECLRKSTRYMSKQWQDDIESSRVIGITL